MAFGVVAMLAAASCQDPDPVLQAASSAVSTPISVTIALRTPNGVGTTSVALAATESLVINAGTTVTGGGKGPEDAAAAATNLGTAATRVEPDAVVRGDLWSASPVDLRDRVHVVGIVHAHTLARGNGVVIDGGNDSNPKLSPENTLPWTVTVPASGPAISLPPDQAGSRGPGSYGAVQVFSRATLTLFAGVYFFDTLQLEPQSHVALDQTAGPVVIYVRDSVQLRGELRATNGRPPDLALIYLGTTEVRAEVPFSGTIAAPNARLFLGSTTPGHAGAFFAKSIEVGPHTTVTYRTPHALLAGGLPIPSCIDAIVPDATLTGRAREVQYQADILRYCTGRDFGPCEATVVGRLNVDFFSAAAGLFREALSPAQHMALVQDRQRKLRAIRGNEALACAIVQHDGDGDFIPDPQDKCRNTPDLTPTLDNGCTDTRLPPAPTIDELRPAFGGLAISGDPRCAKAPSPILPAPLGAWRFPPDPTQGKAIWVSRDIDTSGCPIWFEVEVELTDGRGVRHVVLDPREDTTLPWISRPPGAVQFNLTTTDPGNRGAWASYAVYTQQYRVRAINGAGRRSSWSNWFNPGTEDCLAGRCPDRGAP